MNYLQHWRLEKLVNGSYAIESVFDGKVLAGDLTLKKREGTVAEEWTVVRLDDPRALPPEQVQEYEVSSAVEKIIPNLPTVCTVIDIRDSNGKPRYIDRLSLRAWNYELLTERKRVARHRQYPQPIDRKRSSIQQNASSMKKL